MDKYFDKANVKVAVEDKTKCDMSSTHISTSDFMKLSVAKVFEMVPGSKVDVNMETFSRLNPLVVPTFGKAVIKTSKFFVPFRVIQKSFNDMVVDTVHVPSNGDYEDSAIIDGVPVITNVELYNLFMGASGLTDDDSYMVYSVDPLETANDITIVTGYTGGTTQIERYNFTNIGRSVYSLLLSLGYNIVWDANYVDEYSLLPILGLMRIYADWYYPQQYSNYSIYQKMLTYCNQDNGIMAQPDLASLRSILRLMCFVQYESSVVTSAWDQPNSPSVGNYSSNYKLSNIDTISQVVLKNPGSTSAALTLDGARPGYVTNNAGSAVWDSQSIGGANAPFISPYTTAVNSSQYLNSVGTPISEYLLHSLHSLTDFLKRHQLVGSRAYERLLSRYGVSTPAEKINRSVFLGSNTQAVQIGDVMSTADTDGAELGTFAGKGMSYGQDNFSFSSDEFGYVYVLSSIVPITGYYQGIDPLVLRTRRTQFYIPEFDSLGVEPVLSKTIYTPEFATSAATSGLSNHVYGFLPRYYSYKTSCHDTLSGNFRCASLNGTSTIFPNALNGSGAWHLMRQFDYSDFPTPNDIVHSADIMLGQNDSTQYKRLFYFVGNDKTPVSPDNFTLIYNFDTAMYFPGKSLFDTYEFEDGGKTISTDVGGVKVN